MVKGCRLRERRRGRGGRPCLENLEARQLLAAQVYDGALNGKIVFTSAGHGWDWNAGLGRYATDRGDNNEIVEDFGNQDQLTYYADYLLRAGATVVPLRPVGHQTREIVLDNDSPGVSFAGSWTNSSSSVYYDEDYGAGLADAVAYRFAAVNTSGETAVATYQPTFAAEGFYPVYTWALDSSNRTTQLYRVNHTGGSTEIRVDHRKVGKGWVYLGTYHFDAGSSPAGNVQVSNFSPVGGFVIADAIRFGNGIGDYADPGAPGPSGYPREDENSYKWIARSIGVGTSLATAIGAGTNNISAPSNFAQWMNADSNAFGTSVYIGFHSNAGGGRGARGLIDTDVSDRTPHQVELATYTGRQINQDMQALNGSFEHNWSTGTTHTFTDQFGEINLGGGAEMDATIIETAFHDSVLDAQLMRDPRVRDQIARSTYEATLEYFDNFGGLTAPASQPDQPTNVRAVASASGAITVTWSAPASRTGGPGAATAYRVYTSRDGYGFSNPAQTAGTSLTIPANQLDGNAYYFKVAAINSGGEGPGSVVVGARKNGAGGGGGANRILVVNGFDRYERSQNQRQAYPFSNPDGFTDRVRTRYNNTFDYVARFGEAIEAYAAGGAALGFDTVQNEQVAGGVINLANYQTVLWISGDESTGDETFSSAEQTKISAFLDAGGRLFVSGAEIGWDLDRPSGPTTADRAFYNGRLHAAYVADDANTYTASGASGSIFAGLSLTFDNGANSNDDNIYNVDFPDVLAASGTNSVVALNYTGSGSGGAAVQWLDPAGGARVVNFGFPFETLTSAARRNDVMAAVLGFFQTAVVPTPPVVAAVFANSSAGWGPTFRNFLTTSGQGEAVFGFRVPADDQTRVLPWINLDQFSVRFSENVSVAADDLVVRGVNSAVYPTVAFAYDPATFTATWTLGGFVSFEKILLDLDAGAGTGVTDTAGTALDGEWTNPVAPATAGDAFPSGDGSPGGNFRFRVNILPGDTSRNGAILGNDVTLVRLAQGLGPGEGVYTIFKDVNGSGSILGNDVTFVRVRQGNGLPEGEPAAPTPAFASAAAQMAISPATPMRATSVSQPVQFAARPATPLLPASLFVTAAGTRAIELLPSVLFIPRRDLR